MTFDEAQAKVKNLKARPSNDELLELYALYKQGTAGDASGKRPGMFDMKERAKWDAWATKKGVAKDQAQQKYVTLVEKLAKQYGG
jgi:diazepam-binding inhibitor (GABA receptor modulator, acyl-CoA-binding protein)